MSKGKIIFLNGTSSSGKTSLAIEYAHRNQRWNSKWLMKETIYRSKKYPYLS